ncbi:hypothetical protein TWF281_001842 [Arthrobotrys megalospora]
MRSLTLVLSLLASSALAHCSSTTLRACNANNCLRAVRATNSPTRTLDCSSYFKTTVTPAIVTHTDYVTVTSTYSETLSLTETNTEFATLTNDVFETATVTESITTTITVSPPAAPSKVKRQQTVIPSSIPAYASSCPDAAAYSSACSCIGVVATTITVAAPSTTVTETISQPITITETSQETITITTTDATVSKTLTVSTETVTTAVATETATACIFQLQSGLPGQYIQFRPAPAEGGLTHAQFTTERSDASRLIIAPNGRLLRQGGSAAFIYQPDSSYLSGFTYLDIGSYSGAHPVSCTVSAIGFVTCSGGGFTEMGIYATSYSLNMAVPGFNWPSIAGIGPIPVLCLPWSET